MKYRRSFAALAVAATLLLPGPALAAGPSDADRATARALAAQGHQALDDGDYATAADRFARADALVHAPTLMLGLARAQAGLGKLVAANESLNRILREGVAPDAPKVFAEAVDNARKALAAIGPRLCWVTLTVSGAAGHEGDVKVLLDGAEVPSAAIGVPRAVDPGRHLAVVTLEGAGRAEATVSVTEGGSQTVLLVLKPEAGHTATTTATAGQRPEPSNPPPPPPPPPASTSSTRMTLGFASLGVGGAGLIVGAVTGGLVLGMHGTLVAGCPQGRCPSDLQSKLDSYNHLGLASTVGFIAGGVLAGLGVVLVVTAPKNEKPMVGVTVIPTTGGGTFGAVGSF